RRRPLSLTGARLRARPDQPSCSSTRSKSSSKAVTAARAASASVVKNTSRIVAPTAATVVTASVWLEADPALTTLLDYHYKRHYQAERGQHGKGANRHGAGGDDLTLRVPVGTVVSDRESDETLGDLTGPGQRILVQAGARGGRGNARFASATNRAPRKADL